MTSGDEAIEIPLSRIKAQVLDSIIEEFIAREGTDYGHGEYSQEQKIIQVKSQLQKGLAKVYFDPKTETVNIVPQLC